MFKLWTALHAIGAAGERRVWTQFGRLRLYPNLFVFLVGPPGLGKTVILNPMADLIRKGGAFRLAPDDCTKQGLLDDLAAASKADVYTRSDGTREPFDYHFMALHVRELANFMSQYDKALAGLLTDLFDCPSSNEEKKRGHDKGKLIPFPGVSMIVGTATRGLGTTITDEIWGTGFMARVILVYSNDFIIPEDRFAETKENAEAGAMVVKAFRQIAQLKGPMTWDLDAKLLINALSRNATQGAPLHNRLADYVTRRWLHLGKLCMISALNDERTHVLSSDYHRALSWLLAAESSMTEVFKDMTSHADGAIHEELRQWAAGLYFANRKSLHISALYKFLSQRAASHMIPHIIDVAVAGGFFRLEAGTEDCYVPVMGTDKPTGVF